MNKSLQYNYNQKKQKKPPRIAYVPKNSINLTGTTNNESFLTKPMTNPIMPHAYKSSTSLPSYRANHSIKEGDNDDDSNKPFVLFEHKLVNATTFLSQKIGGEPTTNTSNTDNNIGAHISLKEAVLSLMEKFKERNVKKIVNVYQESYRDNKKASGFGDFLRGCYYLMQFCRENFIQFDMNMMNHPLSKYFTHKKFYLEEQFSKIEPLPGNNFTPYIDNERTIGYKNDVQFSLAFVKHLLESPVYEDTIYLYSIAYPYSESISELDKMYIRYCLEPTREIEEYVESMMFKLNISTRNYITIHIRSGDRFLIDGATNMSPRYLSQIRDYMNQLVNKGLPSNKYLLLSDNMSLKHLLIEEYGDRLCATFMPITHSGEGVVITDTSIKNTLLDFYLLSKSSAIYSYSCFNHGTGFSKWTAKTYNIPYICKFVDYI